MPMKYLKEVIQLVPVPVGYLSLEVCTNLIITSIYDIETTNIQKSIYIANQYKRGHQSFKPEYLLIFWGIYFMTCLP